MNQNLVSQCMRDHRKSAQYFINYLTDAYADIKEYNARLIETFESHDNAKRQRILTSFTNICLETLQAEFSAGADKCRIAELLNYCCYVISWDDKPSYDELMIPMSLAIILDCRDVVRNLITKNTLTITSDRLLNYLYGCISSGTPDWDRRLHLWPEYATLDYVFMTDDEIEQYRALRRYLLGWYNNHANDAWYDDHKSDADTYRGYWSFETAAIAISLGMSDDDFRGVEYYPAF